MGTHAYKIVSIEEGDSFKISGNECLLDLLEKNGKLGSLNEDLYGVISFDTVDWLLLEKELENRRQLYTDKEIKEVENVLETIKDDLLKSSDDLVRYYCY